MKEKLKEQKLVFISLLFLMIFSYPFTKMMNGTGFIAGIPQFYFYIFSFWLLSILLIWLIADTHTITRKKKDE